MDDYYATSRCPIFPDSSIVPISVKVVAGQFEELNPVQHREDADRAYALLRGRSEWWLPGAAETPSTDLYRPIVYRIRIESMSGRRAADRPPA